MIILDLFEIRRNFRMQKSHFFPISNKLPLFNFVQKFEKILTIVPLNVQSEVGVL